MIFFEFVPLGNCNACRHRSRHSVGVLQIETRGVIHEEAFEVGNILLCFDAPDASKGHTSTELVLLEW
jgi:hypothetical protein